jgi:hypothetical protein
MPTSLALAAANSSSVSTPCCLSWARCSSSAIWSPPAGAAAAAAGGLQILVAQKAIDLAIEVVERSCGAFGEVAELRADDGAVVVLHHERQVDDRHDAALDEVDHRRNDLSLEFAAGELDDCDLDRTGGLIVGHVHLP